ncbi:MAG TPA: PspC domain-containing protein [Anaerolineales bacterium]|nr:PspC domain-containing protein [Anaerolineales bacterium]
MNRRLYRSRTNSMIAGVCGGLGAYLRIDPTLVRLFFVLISLAGNGIGLFVYILLWIILPSEEQNQKVTFEDTVRSSSTEIADRARAMGEDLREMVNQPHPQTGLIIGAALIIAGLFYLVQNLNLAWLTWLDFDVIWPLLLVVGGVALLIRNRRGE